MAMISNRAFICVPHLIIRTGSGGAYVLLSEQVLHLLDVCQTQHQHGDDQQSYIYMCATSDYQSQFGDVFD